MLFKHKDVTYVHAPKIGSRSILGWFALLKKPGLYQEHPEYFPDVNVEDHVYSQIRFMQEQTETIETPFSFCVTRDPVQRFVSGFKNRVLTHKRVTGVDNIDQFVDNFERLYAKNKDVNTHFKPLTHWYGFDKSRYSKVFRTENLDECRQWLSMHFERTLPRLHLQQNPPNVQVEATDKVVEFVHDFYKADYKNGWT